MTKKPVIVIQETPAQLKLKADKTKAEALKSKSNPSIKDVYEQNLLITDLLLGIKEKLQ